MFDAATAQVLTMTEPPNLSSCTKDTSITVYNTDALTNVDADGATPWCI